MLRKIIRRLVCMAGRPPRESVEYYRLRGAKIGSCPVFAQPRLAEPHSCAIGHHVWVTGNVTFLNHDGGIGMLSRAGRTTAVNVVGKIVVHDNVFIGIGSTIMPDVEIGPNANIAAGSLVTRDVPPETVVGGCPAKPICTIDEYLAKYAGDEQTLWVEREDQIRAVVVQYFMEEGQRGRRAIRLRHGRTALTQ